MIKKISLIKGFTLVELIVSITITAFIMLGMSTFFSSTLHNMYETQNNVDSSKNYSLTNQILASKLGDLEEIKASTTNTITYRNKTNNGQMPFSYIGLNLAKNVVFKDYFPFDGRYLDKTSSSFSNDSTEIKTPAGITSLNGKYYITAPLENKIYECTNETNCIEFIDSELKNPIGITADNTNLFVADSGNNRIIQINSNGQIIKEIKDLNFPVGIEYYNNVSGYLFFTSPYENKVYRVKTDGNELKVIAGGGDNEDCDNITAFFCKLDFPTGIVIGDGSLYIADTGNNRILKISDPGKPITAELSFNSPEEESIIKEIKFTFPVGTTFNESTTAEAKKTIVDGGDLTKNTNEIIYKLWTTLSNDTTDTNACTPIPCDPPKVKIELDNPDIFTPTNTIKIESEALNSTIANDGITGNTITIEGGFSTHHLNGKKVLLMTPTTANSPITFTFEDINTASTTPTGFQNISIEIFNTNDAKIGETQTYAIRIGDGILGTFEDKIEVLKSITPTYPTGLGFNGDIQVGNSTTFNSNDEKMNFDYVSDFEVEDFTIEQDTNILNINMDIIKEGGFEPYNLSVSTK